MGSELRALIQEMSFANPLWGAPRVHGELLNPGLRHLATLGRPADAASPKPPSQSWKSFLENHVADLVSVDFFVVPR